MRKLVAMAALTCLGLMVNQANAQFVFPNDPTVYTVDDDATVNLNDMGNTAGVTAGQYSSFDVTVDWVGNGGANDAWSNEANVGLTIAAGTLSPTIGPTNGAGNSAAVVGLAFTGVFGGIGLYDPDVDGSLDLLLNQPLGVGGADWSNILLTLNPFVAPPTPTVEGTLTNAPGQIASNLGAAEVLWAEIIHDGGALNLNTIGSELTNTSNDTELALYDANGFLVDNNDDIGGGNLLSELDFAAGTLAAGTYYAAYSAFSTIHDGENFGAVSTSARFGPINLNVNRVPEPGTFVLLGVAGLGLVCRRRR